MTQLWTDDDFLLRRQECEHMMAELAWHNRRLAAQLMGWPVGVLQMCEHLDAVHPGWMTYWRRENTIKGWEHPAGYIARRERSGYVCGVDPVALEAAMAAAPDERHWHYHSVCCDLHPGLS